MDSPASDVCNLMIDKADSCREPAYTYFAGVVACASTHNRTGNALPTFASRSFRTARHTTHYLEAGTTDGPLMIFLHGWPELGLIWRAQIEAFATDGWRCIAPDMRGYGDSSIPLASSAYTQEQVVADMAALHDHLGGRPAIWIGHDWGSVTVGSLVSHEPARSRGAVFISVPYFPAGHALQTLIPLINRTIYPRDPYPDGQWDYYRYYNTHFASAVGDLDADKAASLALIYRSGDPDNIGLPASNATVTRKGGRFGAEHRAPSISPDRKLLPPADFDALVRSFEAHGFRGPCSWYLNDDANLAYAGRAPNGGRLSLPVLFVNGDYDQMNTILGNHMGDPMHDSCADLTVAHLPGAHWLPVECKAELVVAIRGWLQDKKLMVTSEEG